MFILITFSIYIYISRINAFRKIHNLCVGMIFLFFLMLLMDFKYVYEQINCYENICCFYPKKKIKQKMAITTKSGKSLLRTKKHIKDLCYKQDFLINTQFYIWLFNWIPSHFSKRYFSKEYSIRNWIHSK